MNRIAQARELISAGFRVLPLIPAGTDPATGKPLYEPAGTYIDDEIYGPEWFGEPGTEIAILGGTCPAVGDDEWLVVLDIDNHHPDLDVWLASLPPTLTGHDGAHHYYRVPAGALRNIKAFKRPGHDHDGLDVKGHHAYVRARWTWSVPPSASAIATLPPEAISALVTVGGVRATAPASSESPAALVDRGAEYLASQGFDPIQVRTDALEWLRTRAPKDVPEGQGGAAGMLVAGALMVGFGLDDNDTLELMIDYWAPMAWPDEDPDEDGLARKVDEIDRLGSATFEPLQLAALARRVRQGGALTGGADTNATVLAERRAAAAIDAGGIDHPTEDHSGLQLCPRTGWPWILQRENRFWLHRVDAAGYHDAVSASELVAALRRELPNQVLFTARKQLDDLYVRPVGDPRSSYLLQHNVYDPITNTLTLRQFRCMDPARAQFHTHIDNWLRALFGSAYDLGEQWLAAQPDLRRPVPCLYLSGPKELGKSLLVNGLSALWGASAPGKLREAMGNFNQCLAECPLVFGDEGFPSDISFDWFRDAITSYTQRVNTKGLRQFQVAGCARYVVAANNLEGLRYLKTGSLSSDDMDAINARLLVIEGQPEARDAWKAFDTARAARTDIAEHVLWLSQNVPLLPEGERMACRSHGGGMLLDNILTGRYPEILEVLRANLEADGADDVQGRDKLVWVRPNGQLYVSVGRLHARLKQAGEDVPLKHIQAFCSSHQARAGNVVWKDSGTSVKVRVLDADSVMRSIEGLD